MAVHVDNLLPITVSITKISDPIIRLKIDNSDPYILTSYDNFDNPETEGALIKCALKLIGYPIDSGLEIVTTSTLPHGSGLGASSILGATLLRALYKLQGVHIDNDTLVRKVLDLEQMMTTGGGWQDQVGAIYPGIKRTQGNGSPNIALNVTMLECPDLDKHMCLIFTGKTRLAKNLLQSVVANWNSGDVRIKQNIVNLVRTADAMTNAITDRNIPKIGGLLTEYWEQKKIMAPEAEPPHVTRIFSLIKQFIWGHSLCGAGGGGFAVVITKVPAEETIPQLEHILRDEGCTIHRVQQA
jgi:fucokinase